MEAFLKKHYYYYNPRIIKPTNLNRQGKHTPLKHKKSFLYKFYAEELGEIDISLSEYDHDLIKSDNVTFELKQLSLLANKIEYSNGIIEYVLLEFL